MTDAAIAADGGAVDNDIGGTPLPDNAPGLPNPLGSQIPSDDRDDGRGEPASLDSVIDRAFAKSEAKEAEAKAAPEKVAKDKGQPARVDLVRGEDGKFSPKEVAKAAEARPQDAAPPVKPGEQAKPGDQQQAKPALPSHTAENPPARFSETAKAKWASADPELRGEVSRMERELTQGFQKHRESAEKFEGYRELDDIARKHGHHSGAAVFREYYQTEQLLQKDLVGGLDSICQKMGVSLRDVAAHVLNQPAEQQTSQQDATIRELKQEIAGLKQQVGGVVQTHQKQTLKTINTEVSEFAAAHPRFTELEKDIAFFLETRCPGNLEEAYTLAERLNPVDGSNTNSAASSAAATPAASSAAADDDEAAQTRKGTRSINGAPSAGSHPGARKRAPQNQSLDEALDRAFAAAG